MTGNTLTDLGMIATVAIAVAGVPAMYRLKANPLHTEANTYARERDGFTRASHRRGFDLAAARDYYGQEW